MIHKMRPTSCSSSFLFLIIIISLALQTSTIKISTTATNAQAHLASNNPTTLTAALKKSVKVSNFPQLNGKPFIPFYSKNQISLLQNQISKELGNGQFSLNDYLNEFDPQLAEEISEEVRNQLLQQIHEEAESAVFSCNNLTNQFLQTVCLMCKAEKAYLLTSENWFTVGLDNSYKDEFAKILNYAQYYVPNVRWIATFGENSICLGSVDPTENLDIDNLLDSVTSRNTSYYIKPDFIPKLDQSQQVNFAAFEYIPLGDNHSFIIDLIINYQQEFELQLPPSATLNFESIWIRSQEETSFASGLLSLSPPIPSIPFTLDLSTTKEYYLVEGDFSSQFVPLLSVYQVFNDDTEQLVQTISLPSVSNIEAFITSRISLRFELISKKIVQVNMELEKSPDFAITPEFYFIDPKFQIVVNFDSDEATAAATTTTLKVEAIAQDINEQITLQGVLTKTQNHLQEIVLSQLHNPTVQLSILEKIFQTKDTSFRGFFPSNQVFDNIHYHENLQNLTIKIKLDSTPVYHISCDLSPNNGKFESILVIVSGHMNSKTTITFSQKSLTKFLSASTELSDDYIEPQKFTIIHCDHDLDSSLFPEIYSFEQANPYWTKGTIFTYLVSIQDCDTIAFCNVFKNFVSSPTSNIIQLQGTLNEQDQKIELVSASNIQSEDVQIGDLIFRDIHLNIDISLKAAAAADSEIYLSFTNELPVFPNNQKLIFDGKIVFGETNATFFAKSFDTWSSALDLDFLQIGRLELKGSISSNSFLIQNMKAAGILIWGNHCSERSMFNTQRCIYAKSDISLNLQNISKSHAVGAYRGITGSNLLNSLMYSQNIAGYDTNIPKQFTEHLKFLGLAQLKYVPLSTDSTILLESQQDEFIEAGIFVKGHSEFLGIQGETTLDFNPWRKNLEGSFVFGPTDIANSNILLKNMPNKMQLLILKENQPGIIQMEGPMKILNFDGKGDWILSNKETAFTTSISTQLFDTINIKGLLTDIKNLKTAEIYLQGIASAEQMTQLNLKLQQFFDEWTRVISAQFAKIENRLRYFKSLKEERTERLCKEESCELINQCQDEPIKTCLQFDSNNVCNNSIEVCTESIMRCTQTNGLCQEFEHQCSGDFQDVCQEYETQKNKGVCKTSGWTCQESLVPNPACKSECDRKQTEYENIKKFYEALEDNHDRFNIKTETLKQFLADYALNPSVQVTNAEFAILLDSYKTSQDLNWQIEYQISNEDLDIMVQGIDLLDFSEGVAHIAKAIGVQTAQRYNFKWMDIQDMITYLTHNI